jgi:hypothetical protein
MPSRTEKAGYRPLDTPLRDAHHVSQNPSSLLDSLRGTGIAKSKVDPELAGGLREWLEDELAAAVAAVPPTGRAIRLGPSQIEGNGALRGHQAALGHLVACLFRQWVTTGHFDDPFSDALSGEAALGDPAGTVEAVSGLNGDMRRRLAAEVSSHAERIRATWPLLSPSWYPRTRERLTIPLCGGRLVLAGMIDLIVGHQAVDEATKCMVEVSAADPVTRTPAAQLHFYALLETMRAGAAPSRVGTYYTADGTLHVEAVDEHMLVGALLRTIEVARRSCALRCEEPHAGEATAQVDRGVPA